MSSSAPGDKPPSKPNQLTAIWQPTATFIKKLWTIINDESMQHLIHWSEDGRVICFPDVSTFSKEILPRYFKHNNWHSFVRQLNMYGFRRFQPPDGMEQDSKVCQFQNAHFYRDNRNDLQLIRRRSSRVTGMTASETSASSITSSLSVVATTAPPEGQENVVQQQNPIEKCSKQQQIDRIMDRIQQTEQIQSSIMEEALSLRENYERQQNQLFSILNSALKLKSQHKEHDVFTLPEQGNNALHSTSNTDTDQEGRGLLKEALSDAASASQSRLPSFSEVISTVDRLQEHHQLAPITSISTGDLITSQESDLVVSDEEDETENKY